jgi:hypothetical protein
VTWRHRPVRYSNLELHQVTPCEPRTSHLTFFPPTPDTIPHTPLLPASPADTGKVAPPPLKLNPGKQERNLIKYRYDEIREHPLFVDNTDFPTGKAKFVFWWISCFPGPTFPTQQEISRALLENHPRTFDFASFDLSRLSGGYDAAAATTEAAPRRSLADRISLPLANRITFPSNQVRSGRVTKRKSGSRRR